MPLISAIILLLLGACAWPLPSHAAMTHVADRTIAQTTGVDSASSAAFTPGAGNLLVVTVQVWATATPPGLVVSDNVNGTYTQAFARTLSSTTQYAIFQYYKNNVAASSTVVTVNPTPPTAWFVTAISEFTGQDTTSAVLDTTATTQGLSTSSSTVTLTTAAPSVASNAVVAAMAWTAGTRTVTPGGGYTQVVEVENGGSGGVNYLNVMRTITTTATAITAAWTVAGGSTDGNIGIGVYRAAGGVVVPPPVVKAFPSAEGAGENALGGRGGWAYNINSLNPGAGSGGSCNAGGCGGSAPFTAGTVTFGDCLADRFAKGARTCIFRTGGTINWPIEYPTSFANLTIAGQTAPGGGILLRNFQLALYNASSPVHDVIVRHIRIRPGVAAAGPVGEISSFGASEVYQSTKVIYDHVSFGWIEDDTLALVSADGVTLQWSIISQGITNQTSASKVLYWDYSAADAQVSILHNYFSEYNYRIPSLACCKAQVVNNVMYNNILGPQVYPVRGTPVIVEFINNYALQGPMSVAYDPTAMRFTTLGCGYDANVQCAQAAASQVYVSGNYHNVARPNNTLPEANILLELGSPHIPVVTTPIGLLPPILSVTTAAQARIDVLAKAGAYAVGGGIYATPRRDTLDTNSINNMINGTGVASEPINESAYGTYPSYAAGTPYVDTDGDGIADAWEDSHSLNKNDAADGPAVALNGYTNLENFINELAGDTIPSAPTVPAPSNARMFHMFGPQR